MKMLVVFVLFFFSPVVGQGQESIHPIITKEFGSSNSLLLDRESEITSHNSNRHRELSIFTSCSNVENIITLTSADEICGQVLQGPDVKYVIETSSPINCGSMNGPIVRDTTLDCNRIMIRGDYRNANNQGTENTIGIELQGDAIVENCVVTNFGGRGIQLSGPTGPANRKILYKVAAHRNRLEGIVIESDDDCQLISVVTRGNNVQGLVIAGSGNNVIKSCKFINCSTGIWINNSATGNNKIIDTLIDGSSAIGAILQGQGKTHVIDSTIESSGEHGLVKLASTSGDVWLQNALITDNAEIGIYDLSNAPSILYLESSFVTENRRGGLRNENSNVHISCSIISENRPDGIQMFGSATTHIFDSNVSSNRQVNLDFESGNAAIVTNVRACNAKISDDIRFGNDVDEVVLSSVTCTSTEAVVCAYECNDCDVELPSWCTLPTIGNDDD